MNILMILADRSFPPDIRVEKETLSLSKAGHTVVILSAMKGNQPNLDQWQGVKVIRIKPPRGIARIVNTSRRLIDFYDHHWGIQIESAIRNDSIEVLHVHDLPMLGTALKVGKQSQTPVIADLHENYPAALKYYQNEDSSYKNLIKRYYYHPERWQDYENRCVNRADHVLVVVEEARKRLLSQGIPAQKVTVIENNVDIERFQSFGLDSELITRYEDRFVISYIGGFGGRHRGLDTAISAMPYVLNEIPGALLLLVGEGYIKTKLEEMVADLSLQDHVQFIPWQPFHRVPSYIAASQVCLIPHQANPHTETTSPHKLTQYMLMGKPVVVSSCKPLHRIVNEHACGLVFKAGDPFDLANVLTQLRDPILRQRLGDSGKAAVYAGLNWETTASDLIKIYDQIGSTLVSRE